MATSNGKHRGRYNPSLEKQEREALAQDVAERVAKLNISTNGEQPQKEPAQPQPASTAPGPTPIPTGPQPQQRPTPGPPSTTPPVQPAPPPAPVPAPATSAPTTTPDPVPTASAAGTAKDGKEKHKRSNPDFEATVRDVKEIKEEKLPDVWNHIHTIENNRKVVAAAAVDTVAPKRDWIIGAIIGGIVWLIFWFVVIGYEHALKGFLIGLVIGAGAAGAYIALRSTMEIETTVKYTDPDKTKPDEKKDGQSSSSESSR